MAESWDPWESRFGKQKGRTKDQPWGPQAGGVAVEWFHRQVTPSWDLPGGWTGGRWGHWRVGWNPQAEETRGPLPVQARDYHAGLRLDLGHG